MSTSHTKPRKAGHGFLASMLTQAGYGINPLLPFLKQRRARILASAGIDGFLGNLEEMYDHADEEGNQWETFLAAWQDCSSDDEMTVAQLVAAFCEGAGGR
jgi:ribosomal protein L34